MANLKISSRLIIEWLGSSQSGEEYLFFEMLICSSVNIHARFWTIGLET